MRTGGGGGVISSDVLRSLLCAMSVAQQHTRVPYCPNTKFDVTVKKQDLSLSLSLSLSIYIYIYIYIYIKEKRFEHFKKQKQG